MWFSLFGGAVVWWCAAEVRLRRTLRRVGVSGMARVVPASELEQARQDRARVALAVAGASTPADEAARTVGTGPDAAGPDAGRLDGIGPDGTGPDTGGPEAPVSDEGYGVDIDHADNAPLLSFEAEGHGEVVTRPRGWTSIRRSSVLVEGALVPIAYDPKEPTRVALLGVPQSRSDLFWLLLGLAFAACGVTLLATAF
ncbi:DUF3592 domain-containing protein [Streptacidiphilus sp. MAP12-33]|uniref:DUF3592 domain-containing protein n=1 Tax=Streptacidiphilus sp. MAP12-33 TaxID=3156266 RepID=UPI003516018B